MLIIIYLIFFNVGNKYRKEKLKIVSLQKKYYFAKK